MSEATLPRREFLAGGATLVAAVLLPIPARTEPADVDASVAALFGDRPVRSGRVDMKVPALSENGYSVPLSIEVDSPMTVDDHVVRIAVFAEANPLPDVVRFELGPRAGRARVQTRFRMADSQKIRVIAEMSDGSLWSAESFVVVTLAACVV